MKKKMDNRYLRSYDRHNWERNGCERSTKSQLERRLIAQAWDREGERVGKEYLNTCWKKQREREGRGRGRGRRKARERKGKRVGDYNFRSLIGVYSKKGEEEEAKNNCCFNFKREK